MPREQLGTSSRDSRVQLRSINIVFDADSPDRIEHFRPTSKSVPVLKSLVESGERKALVVTAPYGSGKSLVAAYALQVIENAESALPVHKTVLARLQGVSPELTDVVRARVRRRSVRGLVIALHGAQESLSAAIADASNASFRRSRKGRGSGRPISVEAASDPVTTLRQVLDAADRGGFDSTLILWDEFGRHLEKLLAAGRGAELADLQTIAELAVRSKSPPLRIALFTHRGLSQYSQTAPQAVRAEWAKVEGRFDVIQYVDDSKEMYRLIAETVADRRSGVPTSNQIVTLNQFTKRLRKAGIFKELSAAIAEELAVAAFPLHPVSLYALPRIASRISQNERTIFSFLAEPKSSRLITLGDIYDYFADSMRADTSAGGAHRQYLETETALRRAESKEEVEVLKSACLLGLGLAGERGHVSRELLTAAVSGIEDSITAAKVIEDLISRKLLLYRAHAQDVSVWHGADVDLRGALEDEKDRQRAGFQLIEFLRKEFPAPSWKPVEFNDDFFMKRFYSGRYVTPSQFFALCQAPSSAAKTQGMSDGHILFVLAESADDQRRVNDLAAATPLPKGALVSVPSREVSLSEPALEVACLEQMIRNADLVGKDPLVELELQHLLDDARNYLRRAVEQLVSPSAEGPRFWSEGEVVAASSGAELRSSLTKITRELFRFTPRINNELINRARVSRVVANARKKLEMAILERAGQERLGIQGDFPDASIFRTVLVNTGLYRSARGGKWFFAEPQALEDRGLRRVWEVFQEFFQSPTGREGTSFETLFATLSAPPIGLRAGVIPVLLASAFRAFPSTVSLRRQGLYVEDVLPSTIEDICKTPSAYTLEVFRLSQKESTYVATLLKVFKDCDPAVTEPKEQIRRAFDCLQAWLAELPEVCRNTKKVSAIASTFRTAVAQTRDPTQFISEDLPALFSGSDESDPLSLIRSIREEIDGALQIAQSSAAEIVRRSLVVDLDSPSISLRERCQKWTKCFVITDGAVSPPVSALLTRMSQGYDSDELLVDSLASHLVGNPTSRWDDGMATRFEVAFSEAVRAAEYESLLLARTQGASAVVTRNLTRLLEGRLRELYAGLAELAGTDTARQTISRLLEMSTNTKENNNGQSRRSSL